MCSHVLTPHTVWIKCYTGDGAMGTTIQYDPGGDIVMKTQFQVALSGHQFRGPALLAALAATLIGCGGGGGDDGGQSPATPVVPPPPVFSLAVDTAPEPATAIVGDPSDPVARASLTFRFTVDQTGQGDRDWRIPDVVGDCEQPDSGDGPTDGLHCFTVTATPSSGTASENTPVTVALELSCERALTPGWQAPVEIILGENDARTTATWVVDCQVPAFDGELIGVEIYQGPFIRAWSNQTEEWTWRTPPRIPFRTYVSTEFGYYQRQEHALTAPMVEVAGRTTLVVARVEHSYADFYSGLALSVEGADGSTAFETIARASDRTVVLAPGEAPPEHVDVRPPGVLERSTDNPRYESEFRLEVPGSVPEEALTGQPFRKGAWRPGSTLVLTLDPAGEAERVAFPIDAEHEIDPFVGGANNFLDPPRPFPQWPPEVRFPKFRSPFELDEPERLVLVPVEAAWEGDVWFPAPDLTPSTIRHTLSDLLAFLPFGDYRVEVVSDVIRIEVDPSSPATGDPSFSCDDSISAFSAVAHLKTAFYDMHDFVIGLDRGTSNLWCWFAGGYDLHLPRLSAFSVTISPRATANTRWPSTIAHEVGHTLGLDHAPACTDVTLTPHWPDGIAYWDDAPGPVRQWWTGDWTDANDGRFNIPRTSEQDSRLEVGTDLMGYCHLTTGTEEAISDWHYQSALLARASSVGWLDMPEEAAPPPIGGAQPFPPGGLSGDATALQARHGPSVVVTGAVNDAGEWSVHFVDLSERAPMQSQGSHRLSVFGPDGTRTGEAFFDPAPVSHGGGLVWSVRVGFSGETPVRLTVETPDGSVVLDWAVSFF